MPVACGVVFFLLSARPCLLPSERSTRLSPSIGTLGAIGRMRGGAEKAMLGNRLVSRSQPADVRKHASKHTRPDTKPSTSNQRDADANHAERRLFVSLGAMLFCALFSYQLLQTTKDTIVVDACGAEAITFIKVYGVLPASMLFLSLHASLSRNAPDGRPRSDAYVMASLPFIVFFLLFGAVLYPLRDRLHPKSLPELPGFLGQLTRSDSLKSVQLLIRHWTYSLFYIFSELYGNVGVAILFWQFANAIVSMRQARRLYPVLSRYTWIAPALAGQAIVLADRVFHGSFTDSMRCVTGLVVLSGLLMLGLHRTALDASRELERLRPEAEDVAISVSAKPGKRARKPGLLQSVLLVSGSPYLACVCVLVLAYGLCMNFTEVLWKTSLQRCYPDLESYQTYLGWFSTALGLTIFAVSLVAPAILRVCGWQTSSLLVPLLMAGLAVPLYASAERAGGSECSPIAVLAGAVHNLASKSLKFTLFDPTKNMAYLPLLPEVRAQGQAAIDVLGGRLGKSGAALLQQLVIVVCGGDIVKGVRAISLMYALATIAWVWAINSLSRKLPASLLQRARLRERRES